MDRLVNFGWTYNRVRFARRRGEDPHRRLEHVRELGPREAGRNLAGPSRRRRHRRGDVVPSLLLKGWPTCNARPRICVRSTGGPGFTAHRSASRDREKMGSSALCCAAPGTRCLSPAICDSPGGEWGCVPGISHAADSSRGVRASSGAFHRLDNESDGRSVAGSARHDGPSPAPHHRCLCLNIGARNAKHGRWRHSWW